MSSLFACSPANAAKQQSKTCIFEGVSPCRDQVSHVICNAHSAIFGLINKTASYHDGDNDIWTKIVTYNSSSNNICIPLFLDSSSKIMMSEIRAFCINACNSYPTIKVEALSGRIACLMGVSMNNAQDFCRKSWFDDPNSALIIRNNTGSIQYFKDLPPLHKYLFFYINASNIRNSKADTETYLVPNLSLTRNDSSDSYSFIIPNKKNILKYTDKPDCIATPIVLDGIREVAHHVGDRTFAPIQNNFALLC
nr:TPA: vp39 [Oryctes rhinoceros nudivirus]